MATIVAEWMETSEEREERRLKELQRLARLKQYQRELHEANVRLCAELVDEFIVEAACLKAYMRDMGRRSKVEALRLAEAAMHHRFSKALCANDKQESTGGIPFHKWTPDQIPAQHEVAQLEKDLAKKGTWVDRARNNEVIKFKLGQQEVVRHPRFVEDKVHFVGAGTRKKPREIDGLGPSWRELYVGQRVCLTLDAVLRRERYHIADQAGVSVARERGDTVYKATRDCAGVIVDFTKDLNLKMDTTYAPGQKVTNYVSFPGGGALVRWELTGETTYNWTERLQVTEEGNTIDEVEFRTNLIEEINDAPEKQRTKISKRNWGIMDEKATKARMNTKQLPEWMVFRLREMAMDARIRAHAISQDKTSRNAMDDLRRLKRKELLGAAA